MDFMELHHKYDRMLYFLNKGLYFFKKGSDWVLLSLAVKSGAEVKSLQVFVMEAE